MSHIEFPVWNVEITKPIYLLGKHNNIPLKKSWNGNLIQGLNNLVKELGDEKSDVFDVEVERNDDFNEDGFAGFGGYSVVVGEHPAGDSSYYIDFLYTDKNDPRKSENEVFVELNKALTKYIAETKQAGFHKSKFEYHDSWDDDGNDISWLRAFFIGKPE